MPTRPASLAQTAKTVRVQPAERPERDAGPDLGVVDQRHVVVRSQRRQARVLIMLSAALVAGPLLLAALGHALVSTDQVRSDTLQTQIAQALQVQQDYQLQKAELVAPSRILAIAETHLHMITPHSVIYLPPVNPGKTVAQAHVPGSVTIPVHQAAGGAGTKDGSSSGSTTASHARP